MSYSNARICLFYTKLFSIFFKNVNLIKLSIPICHYLQYKCKLIMIHYKLTTYKLLFQNMSMTLFDVYSINQFTQLKCQEETRLLNVIQDSNQQKIGKTSSKRNLTTRFDTYNPYVFSSLLCTCLIACTTALKLRTISPSERTYT